VQTGDLRAWARDLDGLQYDSVGKVLLSLPWSPLGELDLASVPCDPTLEQLLGGGIRVWFGGGDVASPDQNLHGQIGVGVLR